MPSNGKHAKSRAMTHIVEFPERAHFTAVQPRREDVADCALQRALNPVAELSTASAVRAEGRHAR